MEAADADTTITGLKTVPRLIAGVVSGAFTGIFALAGACTGALTGAIAGRASHYGVLRGAGLGAIAGAVLSVEILEASRAYWCLELSGSRGPSSMGDFIEELFRGRLMDEQFMPTIFSAYQLQVRLGDANYEDTDDVYGEAVTRGLSGESLRRLPCYIMLDGISGGQRVSCTICLQEIEAGEMTRSLPSCSHTFHLVCVDRWLIGHGSCPVCRQPV